MTLLLNYARDKGLAMGSLFVGKHFGFTTNEELAKTVGFAGGTVMPCYNATGPRGWEVSFQVGAEVCEEARQAA